MVKSGVVDVILMVEISGAVLEGGPGLCMLVCTMAGTMMWEVSRGAGFMFIGMYDGLVPRCERFRGGSGSMVSGSVIMNFYSVSGEWVSDGDG